MVLEENNERQTSENSSNYNANDDAEDTLSDNLANRLTNKYFLFISILLDWRISMMLKRAKHWGNRRILILSNHVKKMGWQTYLDDWSYLCCITKVYFCARNDPVSWWNDNTVLGDQEKNRGRAAKKIREREFNDQSSVGKVDSIISILFRSLISFKKDNLQDWNL